MKNYAIPFVLSAVLVAGMTACNRSDSTATAPQSDSSQPSAVGASSPEGKQKASPTPEQLKKREEVRKQIEAVLSPEQVNLLKTKIQQGEPMRKALNEVNLTPDQKAKIREIRKAAYGNRQKSGNNQSSDKPTNSQ